MDGSILLDKVDVFKCILLAKSRESCGHTENN